jgi:hypothetical protein
VPRLGTRDEHEAWKAADGAKLVAPVKDAVPTPQDGFSVAEYLRTTVGALARSALGHGIVSKADAEAVEQAEQMARDRHARKQP